MINENLQDQNLFESSTATKLWIEVILPLAIPKTYTYSVPSNLQKKIKIGCRTEVVFGKNKKYAGIIKSVSGARPSFETKDIINIIDDEPIVYHQ